MLLEKMKNWFRRHMEEQMAKIDLSNISHTYNPLDPKPTYALNPFSMTWENGKRYAILGPSGCGKTMASGMQFWDLLGVEKPQC